MVLPAKLANLIYDVYMDAYIYIFMHMYIMCIYVYIIYRYVYAFYGGIIRAGVFLIYGISSVFMVYREIHFILFLTKNGWN